jgi:hypothetical protein
MKTYYFLKGICKEGFDDFSEEKTEKLYNHNKPCASVMPTIHYLNKIVL